MDIKSICGDSILDIIKIEAMNPVMCAFLTLTMVCSLGQLIAKS